MIIIIIEKRSYYKMKMNFVSKTDPLKYHEMHCKSDKLKIMTGFDTEKIIKEIFESLVQKYNVGLATQER